MSITKLLLTATLACCAYLLNYWHQASTSQSKWTNIHDCIYNSSDKKTDYFYSLNNKFDITYVENSSISCLNPNFPAIHISTQARHNAWIHIVYTDNNNKHLTAFVDTVDPKKLPEIYPFYTLEQDFYDAPLWSLSLFYKPLSFWKGHAWAVNVDFDQKIIKPVGGILWGFSLSYFHLKPLCINPLPLTISDYEKDWKLFSLHTNYIFQ